MNIAFDIDHTLFKVELIGKKPRTAVIATLIELHNAGNFIIVWSELGIEYAKTQARTINIEKYVDLYLVKEADELIDVCFDSHTVNLAKVNIRI